MTGLSGSILPQDRDNRWNQLLDAICDLYRALPEGQAVVSVSARVVDGDGHAEVLVRDGRGVRRRLAVADEAAGDGTAEEATG